VDIPAPAGSIVYAIDDGVVTIAGRDPAYTATVVQIEHQGSPRFYSDYLHIQVPALVTVGQRVRKGQAIAYSGRSESEAALLHFEMRREQAEAQNAVNPYLYLAHSDGGPPGVRLLGVDTSGDDWRVAIEASSQADELDLAGVGLRLAGGAGEVLDLGAVNATAQDAPTNPLQSGVCLQPGRFNSQSDAARVVFTFTGLSPGRSVTARAYDTAGNARETEWERRPSPLTLEPGTRSIRVSAGAVATFNHRLTNVSDDAQTFRLRAISAQGWEYEPIPSRVSIDAGASVNVGLFVSVPPDTLAGAVNCLTLLVTSGDDDGPARGVALDSLVVR
jgi:hypothetical protein